MGKRKHEPVEPSYGDPTLQEHLAAAAAAEDLPKTKRHQELRPAVPSISPIAGVDPGTAGDGAYEELVEDGDEYVEVKPGRRGKSKGLGTTKRAKQNRDAQRAFRERKASQFQVLEDKVNRLQAVSTAHKQLQIENLNMKDYIGTLQRSLIRQSIEVPHPPEKLSRSITRVPDQDTEEGAAEASAARTRGPAMHYVRATSSEVREISDAAIRQRDEEARRNQMSWQVPTGGTQEANIEPALLEQSRIAAS